MAMTNSEIILQESLELMKQGVLKSTGQVLVYELPDGTKVEIPEPEPIVEEPTLEEDTAAMLVDHEFRLTLLELGITE